MGTAVRAVDQLADQADVTLVGLASGNLLQYDGSAWVNAAPSFAASAITSGEFPTARIADDAITAAKLADTAVTAGSYTAADITVDAQGRITAAANGSSGVAWGAITGTLANQTDLQSALDAKLSDYGIGDAVTSSTNNSVLFVSGGNLSQSTGLTWDGSTLGVEGLYSQNTGTPGDVVTTPYSIETEDSDVLFSIQRLASGTRNELTFLNSASGTGIPSFRLFALGASADAKKFSLEATSSGLKVSALNDAQSSARKVLTVASYANGGVVALNNVDAGASPLTITGAASQSADLLACKNSAGSVVFGAGFDGRIKTNQTFVATTPGSVIRKMPVYNAAGTLLGYIPIYDAIT